MAVTTADLIQQLVGDRLTSLTWYRVNGERMPGKHSWTPRTAISWDTSMVIWNDAWAMKTYSKPLLSKRTMKGISMPNFDIKTMTADGSTPLYDRSSVGILKTKFSSYIYSGPEVAGFRTFPRYSVQHSYCYKRLPRWLPNSWDITIQVNQIILPSYINIQNEHIK